MRRAQHLLLGSALCAALISGAASAAADAETEAREHYDRAVQLYNDGAYDAALVELNRAWELKPSYKLLYNIGQVRVAMNDYAGALQSYRQYLEKGGDKVPSARREAVQRELRTLEQRVATVSVETDVPGAEVAVDDVVVGTTPLSTPLVVNAGIRRVLVRHPDYLPQSRRVSLVGGAQEKLSFTLVTRAPSGTEPPVSAPRPGTAAPSPPSSPPGPAAPAVASSLRPEPSSAPAAAPSHHTPWIGWAVAGAFAASATVTGAIALSKSSSLKKKLDTPFPSADDLDSRSSQVKTLAWVTDGLWVGALVASGVSLWLTLDSGSSSAEKPAARGGPSPRKIQVGLGPSEVRLKGSF
jgi:hypothetical protein